MKLSDSQSNVDIAALACMMLAQGAAIILYARSGGMSVAVQDSRGDGQLELSWRCASIAPEGFALSLGDAGAWAWECYDNTHDESIHEIRMGRGTQGVPALSETERARWIDSGRALLVAMEGGAA